MGHVQVAAVDDRLNLVQLHEVLPQGVLPLHAVVQPLELVLGVGGVTAHQVKFLILQGDEPSLVVVLVFPHSVAHRNGLVGGKDGGPGVPLLLGGVPVLQNPLPQVHVGLALLHLGLLQAAEVGLLPLIEIKKSLL